MLPQTPSSIIRQTNLGNLFLFSSRPYEPTNMSSRCLNYKIKCCSLAQKSSYSVFSRYSFLVSCVAPSASGHCMQVQWTNLYNECAAKPWCEARTIPQIHSNFDSILILGVINSSLLNFVSSIQQQPTTNTGSPSNPAIKDVSWYII